MNFGTALEALKKGKRVCRNGWDGKNMFVFLVQGSSFEVNRPPLNQFYEEGTVINYQHHIDLRQPNGDVSTWSPSNADVLAEDWEVLANG